MDGNEFQLANAASMNLTGPGANERSQMIHVSQVPKPIKGNSVIQKHRERLLNWREKQKVFVFKLPIVFHLVGDKGGCSQEGGTRG